MEKYARQAVSEGVKNSDDLHVSGDCEIYRVLNLHYNRNNHIEVWGPQVRASTIKLWHDRFFTKKKHKKQLRKTNLPKKKTQTLRFAALFIFSKPTF